MARARVARVLHNDAVVNAVEVGGAVDDAAQASRRTFGSATRIVVFLADIFKDGCARHLFKRQVEIDERAVRIDNGNRDRLVLQREGGLDLLLDGVETVGRIIADGRCAADVDVGVRIGRKRHKLIRNVNRRPRAVHQRLHAHLVNRFGDVDKLIYRPDIRIEIAQHDVFGKRDLHLCPVVRGDLLG